MKMNLKNSIYTFEQGYSLNSPSSIVVKIDSHDNKIIDKIYVGGNSRFTKIVEVSL